MPSCRQAVFADILQPATVLTGVVGTVVRTWVYWSTPIFIPTTNLRIYQPSTTRVGKDTLPAEEYQSCMKLFVHVRTSHRVFPTIFGSLTAFIGTTMSRLIFYTAVRRAGAVLRRTWHRQCNKEHIPSGLLFTTAKKPFTENFTSISRVLNQALAL